MQQEDGMTHYIPRRLDDKARFLFWDYDVALVAIAGFMLGIIAGHEIILTAIGIGFAAMFSKAKSGKHPGFARHLAYWHIGWPRFKRTPPSHFREFIG